MNNCPIGLYCEYLSQNDELCDNRDYCSHLVAPRELPYEFKPMYTACGNTHDKKLVLVVTNIEKNYDSYSQEFIQLRNSGWCQADPLPYRYYLDRGLYYKEVVRQFTPNYLEFFIKKNNPILLNQLRLIEGKLRLNFFPPDSLPYQYDLERDCLVVCAIAFHSVYKNNKRCIEYLYPRPEDLPYDYVYNEVAKCWIFLVTREEYLDGKKIFAPASSLPQYSDNEDNCN